MTAGSGEPLKVRAKPPYYGCESDSEDRHTWLFCEHDALAICAACGEEWDAPDYEDRGR